MAIDTVQNAIQNWGKLTLVYKPSDADIIIRVTSRPSEDLLAVYDAHEHGNFLWRVMGRDGLQPGETPLVTQFEKGFESVSSTTRARLRNRSRAPEIVQPSVPQISRFSGCRCREPLSS